MIDGHIHIEHGEYTLEWIEQFVSQAVKMQLDEIGLLEHNYIFEEFLPMYTSVCSHSEYVNSWFKKSSGKHSMEEYFKLIEKVRKQHYPVRIRFGLEICYFREYEDLIEKLTKNTDLDFLLGSIHFIDRFAFDHLPEHWAGMDVDHLYHRFFEESLFLAKSRLFDGIGHPDAIKLFGHKPSFSLAKDYEKLAKELSRSGMYADHNSGAARRCPHTAGLGIDSQFLHVLKKHNVNIITSSDAHFPEDVGYKIAELEKTWQQA